VRNASPAGVGLPVAVLVKKDRSYAGELRAAGSTDGGRLVGIRIHYRPCLYRQASSVARGTLIAYSRRLTPKAWFVKFDRHAVAGRLRHSPRRDCESACKGSACGSKDCVNLGLERMRLVRLAYSSAAQRRVRSGIKIGSCRARFECHRCWMTVIETMQSRDPVTTRRVFRNAHL